MANEHVANGKDSGIPPYVSYATFRNFLKTLAEHPPRQIDSSLMKGQSGSAQSQLLTAFRFLGMIGPNGEVTDAARHLISTSNDDAKWGTVVKQLVLPRYSDVIGELDLDTATPAQLSAAFRTSGAEGSVLVKAERFFLRAMDDAGESYSPHFKKPRASTGSRRASKRKRSGSQNSTDATPIAPRSSDDAIQIPLYFKGRSPGVLCVPTDFSEADVAVVEAAVMMAKVYAAQNGGTDG